LDGTAWQKTFDTRDTMDEFWDWCGEAPMDHDAAYKKFELRFKPKKTNTEGMDAEHRSQAPAGLGWEAFL